MPSLSNSPRPVMIYDGDCGFCRFWIQRWRRHNGMAVDYRPYQEAAGEYPDIPVEEFARAVHLVESNGRVSTGAEAVARTLALSGRPSALRVYRHVPVAAVVAEGAYGLVAAWRPFFSMATRMLWGTCSEPSTYTFSRLLFLRGLGLIYLFAFLSLLVQVDGLIGPDGILPTERYLQAAYQQLGWSAFHALPTLAWLHPGGAMPVALCVAGVATALLLLTGITPAAALAGLWVLYLSVTVIGQDFMAFQWDGLLLEIGLVAIFLSPPGWRPGAGRRPPPAAALFLLRWILFRLMFMSGAIKLLSGDPLWRDLSALGVHYQTQPLPHALSWYTHHLPAWLHTGSCLAMLAMELILPLGIWLPRRLRIASAGGLALLQLLIMATGNYGFFNLLTLLLCLLLLDDHVLRRWLPAPQSATPPPGMAAVRPWRRRLTAAAALMLAGLGLLVMSSRLLPAGMVPAPFRQVMSWSAPFRSVNAYGLFAVMTPRRPEIILEGSRDGKTWQAYHFRWKPGEPSARPRWATPHMPRLDWQMWFAALSSVQRTPWFDSLRQGLLEGRPAVLSLLADNPFPGRPPRYVRAVLYEYVFTGPGEDGWWQRQMHGLYAPPASLKED